MGFERLKFTKNWNSATDFPTLETSETQVRADMQLLHDESKNALNALMEALEQGGSDVLVRFGSDEVRYIRMNDSGGLEVSSDGVNYAIVAAGSAGGAAPSIHASQHASGGTDPITPAAIGAQPTVTGAATTITGRNLTANRALVSNSSGKVAVSAVTATELGYLDGVTSGIQNQINNKAASGHTHTATDVGALPITGGTMTGNISTMNEDPIIYPASASEATRFRLYSGRSAEYSGGAGVIFQNKYATSNAGNFDLYAHDGTNASNLKGTPTGDLTWRGHGILHANNYSGYALPLNGSKAMTGALTIEKSAIPFCKVKDTTLNRCAETRVDSGGNILLTNRADDENFRGIVINQESADFFNALQIGQKINNTWSAVTVLHTGNVTAGTTDLTAGTSALTTGAMHLVYE